MFNTGTKKNGAVHYTNEDAVCSSETLNDYHPELQKNKDNFYLPRDMSCPQPIGSVWVANITRWFMCIIDKGNQQLTSRDDCEDACLVHDSIVHIARNTVPYCKTQLDQLGIVPTGGKPKMFVDDTVTPPKLVYWSCKTNTYYQVIGTPYTPTGVGVGGVGGVAVGGVGTGE
jgi:hypothetical protein